MEHVDRDAGARGRQLVVHPHLAERNAGRREDVAEIIRRVEPAVGRCRLIGLGQLRIAGLDLTHQTGTVPAGLSLHFVAGRQLFLDLLFQLIGEIGKMIVHSGHQGPKEIGCSADFLNWLTDPVKNGGGAVVDFGCYGANLMTWLMNGKAPISVSAVLKHIKPDVYPKVDDDATILLEYPGAIGIIEASWNWPFGIKDMEVFGKKGYLHALNGNNIEQRDTDKYYKVEVKPYIYRDYLSYISAVLKGDVNNSNDLSSLENNLIVVRILEAARQSAATGKKIVL